jgi:hypothetical protein
MNLCDTCFQEFAECFANPMFASDDNSSDDNSFGDKCQSDTVIRCNGYFYDWENDPEERLRMPYLPCENIWR